MSREQSKSQQKRFAVRKDPNNRAKETKQHAPKTEYKRKGRFHYSEVWDDERYHDYE